MWMAYTPDGAVRRPYRPLAAAAAYLLLALVGAAVRGTETGCLPRVARPGSRGHRLTPSIGMQNLIQPQPDTA